MTARALLSAFALGAFGLALAQVGQEPALRFSTYKTGAFSQIKDYRIVEIGTSGKWQKYWMEATGNPPSTAPTDINFAAETLLAVHLGERPSSGYSVVVEDISSPRPGQVRISIVEYIPRPRDMVAQVITSPYVIVRMPKPPGRLTFAKREEESPRPGRPSRPPRPRPEACDCPCDCCRRGLCEHDRQGG